MPEIVAAKRHAAKIARRLAAAYPEACCSLDFSTPLQLLVATILSAQCTDVRVNQVTKTLFCKYPAAADYAKASQAELERGIQSTGFFRNKAKSVRTCCQTLLEKYDGQVPKEMDKLVDLPGVGRKTANVVLGTAFGIAAGIVVDTHVARIAHRLGLTTAKEPVKIERDLMAEFPAKEWIMLSHRMIYHGRRCCTARNPKCAECPLESVCPRIGVAPSKPKGRSPKSE
jgi:endonuclease III